MAFLIRPVRFDTINNRGENKIDVICVTIYRS